MVDILFEEKQNLRNMRNKIENRVEFLIKNNKYKDVSEYILREEGVSEEEINRIKTSNRESEEEIDRIKSIYNEPYYGRMDFYIEEDGKTTRTYIGEKSFDDEGELLIHDWRSPIGNMYHAKDKTSINYKGKTYTLKLKRSFKNLDGDIVAYNEDYVASKLEAEKVEEVEIESHSLITKEEREVLLSNHGESYADPFLLQIIKDNRKDGNINNLVKTVQEKQNAIIRLDAKDNFIVQGCAGSGKSMIMLHRLSYLMYNTENFRVDKSKMITHGKNACMRLMDMARDLEISKIPTFTVEDYYLHLLERYRPNLWEQDSLVAREEVLGYDFINRVYSDDFLSQCEEVYEEYMKDFMIHFNDWNLNEVLSKYGIVPFTSASVYYDRKMLDYKGFLEGIIDGNNITKFKATELKSEIDNLESYIKEQREKIVIEEETSEYGRLKNELNGKIKREKDKIQDIWQSGRWESIINKCNIRDLKIEDLIKRYDSIYETILEMDKSKDAEKEVILKQLEEIDEVYEEKNDKYKNLIDFYQQIEKNSNSKIQKLVEELDQTSSLNLVKKGGLEFMIESLKEDMERNKAYFENSISDLRRIENEKKNIEKLLKDRRVESLSSEDFKLLDAIGEELSEIKENIKRIEKSLRALEDEHKDDRTNIDVDLDRLDKMYLEYEKLLELFIQEDDIRCLTEMILKINSNSIENIYDRTFKLKIDELKKDHKIPSLLGSLYRHELYLRLKFYSLYMGPVKGGDRVLSIDEGQEISKNEYRVIKDVNGEKLIFNIYGDVNQLLSLRGIRSWDELDFINDRYSLEENYRNTEEITDFCNAELKLRMKSIGISGENVKTSDEDTALEVLRQGLVHDDERCVVIVTGLLDSDFVEECTNIGLVKGRLIAGKICVLTVDEVKGIEFDRAFVYNRNMNENEKYISYTRALDELIIIR